MSESSSTNKTKRKRSPRATQEELERFVEVWNSSQTYDEAVKRLGWDERRMRSSFTRLKRHKVPLRSFRTRAGLNVARLQAVARKSLALQGMVKPTRQDPDAD